jgi:hypothetical protein
MKDAVGAFADEREQCASAADKGQQLRDEGKYRGAREQFLSCAREVCPGPIRKDCSDWLNQVESVAPSIVIAAKEGTDAAAQCVAGIGPQAARCVDSRSYRAHCRARGSSQP